MKFSEYQWSSLSLTLVKGHSDFEVKCLTFGLYTQVSNSGPLGPLVLKFADKRFVTCFLVVKELTLSRLETWGHMQTTEIKFTELQIREDKIIFLICQQKHML